MTKFHRPGRLAILLPLLLAACAAQTVREAPETLALYEKSMRAYAQGDLQTAERGFEAIVQSVPHDATAWFRLANIYARTDRPRQAVAAYQEALVRNPKLPKAWYNLGIVQLRQAAHSFLSLTQGLPASDPLHQRGLELAQEVIRLLGEVPEAPSGGGPAAGGAPEPAPVRPREEGQ